jgi:hypothetical protein
MVRAETSEACAKCSAALSFVLRNEVSIAAHDFFSENDPGECAILARIHRKTPLFMDLYNSFAELEESAVHGCAACRIFRQTLIYASGHYPLRIRGDEPIRLRLTSPRNWKFMVQLGVLGNVILANGVTFAQVPDSTHIPESGEWNFHISGSSYDEANNDVDQSDEKSSITRRERQISKTFRHHDTEIGGPGVASLLPNPS